jgi:acyl carrier protein
MNKQEKILQEIILIFRKELGDESLQLNYQSTAKSVNKWDSVTNVILLSAIEEKYDIVFPIEFIFSAENIGDLCDYVVNNSKNI